MFRELKLKFFPPRIQDPDFGELVFIHISDTPRRSYWEGEWTFPKTGNPVVIGLPGDESGPSAAAKQFYLNLPARFDEIMHLSRSKLTDVFRVWLEIDLPDDPWSAIKLSRFSVDNPSAKPLCWEVGFETLGEPWLAINVPFIDNIPQKPYVDT